MTTKICVYLDERLEGILRTISNKEGIGLSTILKVAFVDKFSKFYPDLFLIQDEKSEVSK